MELKLISLIRTVAAFLFLLSFSLSASQPIDLQAFWIKDASGKVMLDPQTSALVPWRGGKLLTIADGSAHESQRLKLLQIDPVKRIVEEPKYPMVLSPQVSNSCFAEYLGDRPDLEALVVDPDDDTVFYTITEDASRYSLTEPCQQRYANSGSTPYPTVLVRLQLENDKVVMTHARPLRFAKEFNLVDLPNDGIEGMTFGEGRTLYLALERDGRGNPRIFSITLDSLWWQNEDFADVADPQLNTPTFESGYHPINALSYYDGVEQDWIIAAARNDNQLWLIDPQKHQDTKVIPLRFFAENLDSECQATQPMNNYSMEGVAVSGETLWLINDPWKVNYLKNVQCEANREAYERMAPLLTSIKMSELLAE